MAKKQNSQRIGQPTTVMSDVTQTTTGVVSAVKRMDLLTKIILMVALSFVFYQLYNVIFGHGDDDDDKKK